MDDPLLPGCAFCSLMRTHAVQGLVGRGHANTQKLRSLSISGKLKPVSARPYLSPAPSMLQECHRTPLNAVCTASVLWGSQ